jgi:redox-sensitive bicupin YhaK (pirin superfamily)
MIKVRKAAERGHMDHGWLDTRHTFSWDEFQDPEWEAFGKLLVINEDRVAPAKGFKTHGHEEMEIISYVLEGALEHKDSMGNGSRIMPGEVQRMSAGTGVTHSEFNPLEDQATRFIQIWIEPDRNGIDPGYEQKAFTDAEKRDALKLVASPDGRDGSVTMHADATMHASVLSAGHGLDLALAESRQGWLQVLKGKLTLGGVAVAEGDGAAVTGESRLRLEASDASEILWIDLPA